MKTDPTAAPVFYQSFNSLFEALIKEIPQAAGEQFKQFRKGAQKDAGELLHVMHYNLRTWRKQLINNDLNPDEFRLLVLGQKEVLKATNLKDKNTGTDEIDAFKIFLLNSIADYIINTIDG